MSDGRQSRGVELWLLIALLLALGAISGLRPEDDSYQHFARSYQQVAELDVRAWLLDLWNKPLPGLLYGVPGQLGVVAARCVAVALTVATAWLSAELCVHWIPDALRAARWPLIVLFMSQLALLKDAFVTMTEIPAACLVSLAVWLRVVKQRHWLAALVLGFVPLCRAEMVPIVGLGACWLAIDSCLASREAGRPRAVHALPVIFAAAPFVAWWLFGGLAGGDWGWFSRHSYAYWRSWDLAGLWQHNVFSGLANVAPSPLLFAAFTGLAQVPTLLRRHPHRWELTLITGMLLAHYALLNSIAVFPRDWYGAPAGHAVAAINGRNYSPTAGLACCFAALGVASWIQACRERELGFAPRLWIASGLSAVCSISGRFPVCGLLALDLGMLLVVTGGAICALRLGPRLTVASGWNCAALAALLSCLLIRPFFWYPTRWNERSAESVTALVELARRERPARIVQDLASSLAVFGNLKNVEAAWSWPHEFPSRLRDASGTTLLVLETNAEGIPDGRYPEQILRLVAPDAAHRTPQIAMHFDSPSQGPWLECLNRLAVRNAKQHWTAYRMSPSGQQAPRPSGG